MNYVTPKDFKEVWAVFEQNKEWFPHVRTSHIKNRLDWGQIIFQDGVVLTQQLYQQSRLIGRFTDVRVESGSYLIHQIINSEKGNGKAEKVIKEYFDHVKQNVYLTVRSDNKPANAFYSKVGMSKCGYINWGKEQKIKGNVWKYSKKT